MPDLSEAEAIEALLYSASEYSKFSPNTTSSDKQEASTPFNVLLQDSPLPSSNAPKLKCSSTLFDASRSFIEPLRRHSSLDIPTSQASTDYPNAFLNIVSSSPAPSSQVSSGPSSCPAHSPLFTPQEPLAHPTPPSPNLRRSISSFNLVGTIGCGSYGKVLLGHINNDCTGNSNLHAIKVLKKRDMRKDGAEEVKRELRALRWIADTVNYAGVTHKSQSFGVPFLQKMTESFQNESFVFIVLEYHPVSLAHPAVAARLRLSGYFSSSENNDHSLSQSKSLPISFSTLSTDLRSVSGCEECVAPFESLRLVAAELVLGLIFLHHSGIVHQDIKPANIMISSAGHIVIADFGASTALPFSFDYEDFPVIPVSRAQKTYHSIVLNPHDLITFTPLYAAPELVCRNRAGLIIYDSRVDWWSFGVVLYELATGCAPFTIAPTTRKGDVRSSSDNNQQKKMKRRSLGDFSLSFGAMEKLLADLQDDEDNQSRDSVSQLQTFVRALLVDHVYDRLSGLDVKNHPFFDSLSHQWNEIAALEHPPLPGPPEVSLDPDTSLGIALSPRIRSPAYNDVSSLTSSSRSVGRGSGGSPSASDKQNLPSNLKITWPVPREGSLADDSIHSPIVATNHIDRDENPDLALSLRKTASTSVRIFEEDSFLFIHSDVEGIQGKKNDEEDDKVTEDGTSSHTSPLQPFPSTASLHSALLVQEHDYQHTVAGSASQRAAKAKSETDHGENSDVECDIEDVEVWNPWVPRPFDGSLYPSDSFPSVLPNPYSPQPPFSHRLESTREFQSLNCMAFIDSQSEADIHANLVSANPIHTEDVRVEDGVEDEAIPTSSATNVHSSCKKVVILNSESDQLPIRSKTEPIVNTGFSSVAAKKDKEGEDILFSVANTQSRSKSMLIPPKTERNNEECRSSRSSISVRLSSPTRRKRSGVNSIVNPHSAVKGVTPVEQPRTDEINTRQRRQAKKRFSFPSSFPGSDSKQEKKGEQHEQDHTTCNAPWNPRRRFSAPLIRGPPSSFDAARVKVKKKSHSLLIMSRSCYRTASTKRNASSNSVISPRVPHATAAAAGGSIVTSVLPFPPHELNRMRIEYQNRRATDPTPTPCTPRSRSVNGYSHTTTLGRSTGSKMIAQAQATTMAMRRGYHSEQGAYRTPAIIFRPRHSHNRSQSSCNSTGTGNWCPSLQDELTMAVLSEIESKGNGSRDFTTVSTIRSKSRSKGQMEEISAPVCAQSLHKGHGAVSTDGYQAPLPVSEVSVPTTSTRRHGAYWAGMVGLHRDISYNPGQNLDFTIQTNSHTGLQWVPVKNLGGATEGEAVRNSLHPGGEEEQLGLAFEDPCHRLPMSQDQSENQRSPDYGSGRLYKRRRQSNRLGKNDADGATQQRSLGSRLLKKFKQLVPRWIQEK